MKTCPYCAEAVQDAAIVCRFCQRALTDRAVQNRALITAAVWGGGVVFAAVVTILIVIAFMASL